MLKESSLVLNLTQHNKSEEQFKVIEPSSEDKELIKGLLLFTEMPEHYEMLDRAKKLAEIASKYECERAMIGGAPYFLAYIEDALIEENIKPVHSFSQRNSKESYNKETGIKEKISPHKHENFVEVSLEKEQNITDVYYHGTKEGYLNLTNHDATPAQLEDGVKEPVNKQAIRELITFKEKPSESELRERASKIADIVQEEGYSEVMIAGAPYFDRFLRDALDARGIDSYYAFSLSEPIKDDKGVIVGKTFKHLGFVPSKNTSDYLEEKNEEKIK